MNFYSTCFRKCSSTLTCRLSRHSFAEGFFSTERSTKVSEDGMSLWHSGVTSDLASGATSVLTSVNLSTETASLDLLPSTESATWIPSTQRCKHERWQTSESVCSTTKVVSIYKRNNNLFRNSTLRYPA